MIATPPLPSGDPDPFARAALAAAAQVEADEHCIKEAILTAARAGDCARVIDIITKWMSMPAAEVLRPGTGIAPHGRPQ